MVRKGRGYSEKFNYVGVVERLENADFVLKEIVDSDAFLFDDLKALYRIILTFKAISIFYSLSTTQYTTPKAPAPILSRNL